MYNILCSICIIFILSYWIQYLRLSVNLIPLCCPPLMSGYGTEDGLVLACWNWLIGHIWFRNAWCVLLKNLHWALRISHFLTACAVNVVMQLFPLSTGKSWESWWWKDFCEVSLARSCHWRIIPFGLCPNGKSNLVLSSRVTCLCSWETVLQPLPRSLFPRALLPLVSSKCHRWLKGKNNEVMLLVIIWI